MPDRRQFLALAAVSVMGAALPCPDPLPAPATLAGWTGLLNGAPFTPADAAAHEEHFGTQWQYPVIITDKAAKPGSYGGACERYCRNQRVKGERWVLLGLMGGNTAGGPAPYPPASPEAPFRLDHDVNRYEPEGGPVGYSYAATRVVHATRNCNDSQRTASAGRVELTRIDASGVAGRLELTFNGEVIAGTFDVPACPWTDPQPARTCVG